MTNLLKLRPWYCPSCGEWVGTVVAQTASVRAQRTRRARKSKGAKGI